MTNSFRNIVIAIVIAPILLFLSGCGTLMTKNAPTEKLDQRGNPYSGIQLDLQMMKCSFYLPAIAKKRTNAPYLFSILWIPFVFSVGLIDAPLSLAADTIFLPIDYFVFAEMRKPRLSGSCEDGA